MDYGGKGPLRLSVGPIGLRERDQDLTEASLRRERETSTFRLGPPRDLGHGVTRGRGGGGRPRKRSCDGWMVARLH